MTRRLDKYLRRYVSLSCAIDILENSHLVLLNPDTWDDKNDYYFIEQFKTKKKLKSVYASCFTMATETYHHWRIFTQGSEGICIEFNRERLEAVLSKEKNLLYKIVDYSPIKELQNKRIDDLPFLKRVGYSDEREWRILGFSRNAEKSVREIPLNLNAISKIIINPWMPESLAANVSEILENLTQEKISIARSGLTNSEMWKKAGDEICLI